jgi:cell division protein ZipA
VLDRVINHHHGANQIAAGAIRGFEFMEMLDKTQLQWLLAGIGAVVVMLIYLWGMRIHIREGIRKRRRQPSLQKEPVFGDSPMPESSEEISNGHDFSGLLITPEHPLAEKALIDVEIRPIHRHDKPALGGDEPVAEVDANPVNPVNPAAEVDVSPQAEPVVQEKPSRESRQESPVPSEPPKMTIALTVMAVPFGQSPFKGMDIQTAALDLNFQLGTGGLFERCADNSADKLIFSMAHLRKPGTFEPPILNELTTPGLLLFMNLPGPMEEIKSLDLLVVTADQLAQRLGGMICDERRKRLTNQGLLHLRNEVVEFRRKQRLWARSS